MSLQKLKAHALTNAQVKNEYEKLETEFYFIDQLLTVRTKAGLTQEQVASNNRLVELRAGKSHTQSPLYVVT